MSSSVTTPDPSRAEKRVFNPTPEFSSNGTGIVADPRSRDHDTGTWHPDQPTRFTAVMNRLEWVGLLRDLMPIDSRRASDDELALVHDRGYIDLVRREVAAGRYELSTGDTALCSQSDECARLAAGAALSAIDAIFSGAVANTFCVVRPGGHHAGVAQGMGFCLYNSIAIAARYAQQRYAAERILIVDWDVHHGNGTQDIFYEDGSVLYFSTHQSPWYPDTGEASEQGEGAGAGKTINCPLPAHSDGSRVIGAFRDRLLPALRDFRPDFVLLSAGFDSRINDPLGEFRLTDRDFGELTRIMTDVAADYCDHRLVSVLEGGYNLNGLARASEAHVRSLAGDF